MQNPHQAGGGGGGGAAERVMSEEEQKLGDLGIAEAASPISSRPPIGDSNFEEMMQATTATEAGGSSSNRWPRQETLALIQIRSEMDAAFRDATLKAPLWDQVSRKMGEMGYKRSAKKCKEKFENVQKYYKRTKEGRGGRQDGKTYKFFAQLEALHTTAAAISLPPPTVPQPAASLPHTDYDNVVGIHFSSDEEEEYSSSDEEPAGSRKRKRSHGGGGGEERKMMEMFEGFLKQVMQKQEAMQQKFLETIEKREKDRMIREEAWKRQDIARIARENALLANERATSAARDAAVIDFLQKITGQTIPLPPAAVQPQPQPQPQPLPPPPPPPTTTTHNTVVVSSPPQEFAAPSRWPKAEVLALIKLRSGMDPRYQEVGPKGSLWEEISAGMEQMGYKRSAKRCKEKWENINKYFKKVKESNKKRPQDAKTCPYFDELDALYRKKLVGDASAGGGAELQASGSGEHARSNADEEKQPEDMLISDQDYEEVDEKEEEFDAEEIKMFYKIERQNHVAAGGTTPSNYLAMVQ